MPTSFHSSVGHIRDVGATYAFGPALKAIVRGRDVTYAASVADFLQWYVGVDDADEVFHAAARRLVEGHERCVGGELTPFVTFLGARIALALNAAATSGIHGERSLRTVAETMMARARVCVVPKGTVLRWNAAFAPQCSPEGSDIGTCAARTLQRLRLTDEGDGAASWHSQVDAATVVLEHTHCRVGAWSSVGVMILSHIGGESSPLRCSPDIPVGEMDEASTILEVGALVLLRSWGTPPLVSDPVDGTGANRPLACVVVEDVLSKAERREAEDFAARLCRGRYLVVDSVGMNAMWRLSRLFSFLPDVGNIGGKWAAWTILRRKGTVAQLIRLGADEDSADLSHKPYSPLVVRIDGMASDDPVVSVLLSGPCSASLAQSRVAFHRELHRRAQLAFDENWIPAGGHIEMAWLSALKSIPLVKDPSFDCAVRALRESLEDWMDGKMSWLGDETWDTITAHRARSEASWDDWRGTSVPPTPCDYIPTPPLLSSDGHSTILLDDVMDWTSHSAHGVAIRHAVDLAISLCHAAWGR